MKHLTSRRLRLLALTLSLAVCFSLFAGCSQDSQPSQEPSQDVTQSQVPSADPSADPADTASQPADGTDDTGSAASPTDVAGLVTAVDGSALTLQIYSAPSDAAIEDYAAVDLSQYSPTQETSQADLTGASLLLAQDGALTEAQASQIAVGDMVVLTYEGGQLLQAVIYPQDSAGGDAA